MKIVLIILTIVLLVFYCKVIFIWYKEMIKYNVKILKEIDELNNIKAELDRRLKLIQDDKIKSQYDVVGALIENLEENKNFKP